MSKEAKPKEIVKSQEFFGLYPKQPYGPTACIFIDIPRETKRPLIGRSHLEVEFQGTTNKRYHTFERRIVFTPRYPIEPVTDLMTYCEYLESAPFPVAATLLRSRAAPHVLSITEIVDKTTETFKGDRKGYAEKCVMEFEQRFENPKLWAYDSNGASVRLGMIDESVFKTRFFAEVCFGNETQEELEWFLMNRAIDVRYVAFYPTSIEKFGQIDDIIVAREITMTQPYTINQIPVIVPSTMIHQIGRTKYREEATALVHKGLEDEKANVEKGLAKLIRYESDRDLFAFIWVYRQFLSMRYEYEKKVLNSRKDRPKSPQSFTAVEGIIVH